jgi:hypothetical protein
MLEFAIVLKHKRHIDMSVAIKNTLNKSDPEPTQIKVGTFTIDSNNPIPKKKKSAICTRINDPLQFAHVFDLYAQILFAVSFVSFNIIYWAYYASVK